MSPLCPRPSKNAIDSEKNHLEISMNYYKTDPYFYFYSPLPVTQTSQCSAGHLALHPLTVRQRIVQQNLLQETSQQFTYSAVKTVCASSGATKL